MYSLNPQPVEAKLASKLAEIERGGSSFHDLLVTKDVMQAEAQIDLRCIHCPFACFYDIAWLSILKEYKGQQLRLDGAISSQGKLKS